MLCIIAVPSFPLLLNVLLWNKPQLIMPLLVCHIGWLNILYHEQCYCEHLSTCVLPMHRGSSHYLHRRVMLGSWGNKLFIDLGACHCVQSITPTLPSALVPTLYAISSRLRFSFFGLMVLTDATQW